MSASKSFWVGTIALVIAILAVFNVGGVVFPDTKVINTLLTILSVVGFVVTAGAWGYAFKKYKLNNQDYDY